MLLVGLTTTGKQVWSGRLHMRPIWASEATLAHARESGKGYSVAPHSPSTPRLVVKQEQCTSGPIIAPPSTWSSKVYRHLKLRLFLVTYRKLPLHQLSGVKNSLPGPQEFQASLQGPDCIDSNGQHNCSLLHQQGDQTLFVPSS